MRNPRIGLKLRLVGVVIQGILVYFGAPVFGYATEAEDDDCAFSRPA